MTAAAQKETLTLEKKKQQVEAKPRILDELDAKKINYEIDGDLIKVHYIRRNRQYDGDGILIVDEQTGEPVFHTENICVDLNIGASYASLHNKLDSYGIRLGA